MRKFSNFYKHRKRFIVLSTYIFLIVTLLHLSRFIMGATISVGGYIVPAYLNYLAIFVTSMMAIMGVYYSFHKEK